MTAKINDTLSVYEKIDKIISRDEIISFADNFPGNRNFYILQNIERCAPLPGIIDAPDIESTNTKIIYCESIERDSVIIIPAKKFACEKCDGKQLCSSTSSRRGV